MQLGLIKNANIFNKLISKLERSFLAHAAEKSFKSNLNDMLTSSLNGNSQTGIRKEALEHALNKFKNIKIDDVLDPLHKNWIKTVQPYAFDAEHGMSSILPSTITGSMLGGITGGISGDLIDDDINNSKRFRNVAAGMLTGGGIGGGLKVLKHISFLNKEAPQLANKFFKNIHRDAILEKMPLKTWIQQGTHRPWVDHPDWWSLYKASYPPPDFPEYGVWPLHN